MGYNWDTADGPGTSAPRERNSPTASGLQAGGVGGVKIKMAGIEGLEPPTYGVETRYSNPIELYPHKGDGVEELNLCV